MKKIIINQFIYYIIGSLILSLGITLSIFSNLGAGAFDAQNTNLSLLLGISIGNAMYISIVLLYILTMLLKPKKIYFIGLLLTGLVGFTIDMWSQIIPVVNNNIGFRLMYFAISLVILPLGVTFIIQSRMPLSPMDNLLLILTEKSKWSVAIVKTLIEGSFVAFALLYGLSAGIGLGSISIGTVIITFAIGPAIAFYMKFIKPIGQPRQEKKTINKYRIR